MCRPGVGYVLMCCTGRSWWSLTPYGLPLLTQPNLTAKMKVVYNESDNVPYNEIQIDHQDINKYEYSFISTFLNLCTYDIPSAVVYSVRGYFIDFCTISQHEKSGPLIRPVSCIGSTVLKKYARTKTELTKQYWGAMSHDTLNHIIRILMHL